MIEAHHPEKLFAFPGDALCGGQPPGGKPAGDTLPLPGPP